MKRFFAFTGLCTALGLATNPAFAGSTEYPLTLDNCGTKVTFDKAPERAVGLGQNSAEIMLLLGLEDRMVGTAFWPNSVLPQLADANAKVTVLTVEFPTFESILALNPDFGVTALVGVPFFSIILYRLQRLLARRKRPHAGRVMLDDRDLSTFRRRATAQRVAFIEQHANAPG